MELYAQKIGSGTPVVILHGLYGSGDNWLTLGKELSSTHTVYLVDQRNHGRSAHHPSLSYSDLTEDLLEFLDHRQLHQVSLVGHSMGGKTAMNFALTYPERVASLVVIDIALRSYLHPAERQLYLQHQFHLKVIHALLKLDIDYPETRDEVDKQLAQQLPQPAIRSYLLKNLKRDSDGKFFWAINLSSIQNNLDRIMEGIPWTGKTYRQPTLIIDGKKSEYIQPSDYDDFKKAFPDVRIEQLDTGHWVHAEKPEELLNLLRGFLSVNF